MTRSFVGAVLVAMVVAAAATAAPVPAYIKAAVADSKRAEDAKRDETRKPAEMLVFAGVKPGMKVMDLIAGGGYFTRLFAVAVGPNGWVYAEHPDEFEAFLKGKPAPILKVVADYQNVSVVKGPLNKLTAPEALDLVWTSQNYHDIKNMKTADTAEVNKAVFNALKPGGVYVVLDHSAAKGSGSADTNTLHRIDESVVKKEVEAAGFKFVGESNALRNASDPRTAPIFDKAIRGHTDQFILKFRKPAK